VKPRCGGGVGGRSFARARPLELPNARVINILGAGEALRHGSVPSVVLDAEFKQVRVEQREPKYRGC